MTTCARFASTSGAASGSRPCTATRSTARASSNPRSRRSAWTASRSATSSSWSSACSRERGARHRLLGDRLCRDCGQKAGVPGGLLDRVARRGGAGRRGVEPLQLADERLFVAGLDMQRLESAAVRAAHQEPRLLVVQVGGRKLQLDHEVVEMQRIPLAVPGDAGHEHLSQVPQRPAVEERDAAGPALAVRPDLAGDDLPGRDADRIEHPVDGVHGVDDSRHQRIGVAAQVVAVDRGAQRLGGLRALAGTEVGGELRSDVVGADERPVGDERPRVGVGDFDGDVPQPAPVGRKLLQSRLVVGVEALHVPDLDDESGGVAAFGDLLRLALGEAERLLAEDVQARAEPGQHRVGVEGVGDSHDQRVELLPKERVERLVRGCAVTLADRGPYGGRRVCDPDELEPVAERDQVGDVLDLCDQARPDDAHPKARHLTAPRVRPRTKWRWTRSAKMMIGSAPITPAAAIGPNSIWILPISVETPTGTVWASGVEVRDRAIRKSLYVAITLKIAVAASPGAASGITTRHSAERRESPSTIAASSMSRGISAMKLCIIQITKLVLRPV